MNDQTEAYLSRPVRTARGLGVVAAWAVWLGAVALGFAREIPQSIVIILFVLGFAPYLASLHIVEPWLMRREELKLGNSPS